LGEHERLARPKRRGMRGPGYQTGFGAFGYRLTPWVKRLIIANAVVFVVVWTGVLPFDAAVRYLGFNVSEAWREPWTIITYMFVHAGALHVFLNMLMLFFFGPPLEERWGGKEFIRYYVICGAGGALLSLAFGGGTIVGASGAIFGVLLAYALNWPDSPIWIYAIFPVKAKYLVLFLGALSFFSAFSRSSDGIAHFAHLGGLVVGYVYLKRGWRIGERWSALRRRLRRRRLSVVRGGGGGGGGGDDHAGTGTRSPRPADDEARMLEVVDRLLDKIAARGLDSLTAEERRFLDEVSRRRKTEHEVRH
jgi:membrane associated rhomboid family serine protease